MPLRGFLALVLAAAALHQVHGCIEDHSEIMGS